MPEVRLTPHSPVMIEDRVDGSGAVTGASYGQRGYWRAFCAFAADNHSDLQTIPVAWQHRHEKEFWSRPRKDRPSSGKGPRSGRRCGFCLQARCRCFPGLTLSQEKPDRSTEAELEILAAINIQTRERGASFFMARAPQPVLTPERTAELRERRALRMAARAEALVLAGAAKTAPAPGRLSPLVLRALDNEALPRWSPDAGEQDADSTSDYYPHRPEKKTRRVWIGALPLARRPYVDPWDQPGSDFKAAAAWRHGRRLDLRESSTIDTGNPASETVDAILTAAGADIESALHARRALAGQGGKQLTEADWASVPKELTKWRGRWIDSSNPNHRRGQLVDLCFVGTDGSKTVEPWDWLRAGSLGDLPSVHDDESAEKRDGTWEGRTSSGAPGWGPPPSLPENDWQDVVTNVIIFAKSAQVSAIGLGTADPRVGPPPKPPGHLGYTSTGQAAQRLLARDVERACERESLVPPAWLTAEVLAFLLSIASFDDGGGDYQVSRATLRRLLDKPAALAKKLLAVMVPKAERRQPFDAAIEAVIRITNMAREIDPSVPAATHAAVEEDSFKQRGRPKCCTAVPGCSCYGTSPAKLRPETDALGPRLTVGGGLTDQCECHLDHARCGSRPMLSVDADRSERREWCELMGARKEIRCGHWLQDGKCFWCGTRGAAHPRAEIDERAQRFEIRDVFADAARVQGGYQTPIETEADPDDAESRAGNRMVHASASGRPWWRRGWYLIQPELMKNWSWYRRYMGTNGRPVTCAAGHDHWLDTGAVIDGSVAREHWPVIPDGGDWRAKTKAPRGIWAAPLAFKSTPGGRPLGFGEPECPPAEWRDGRWNVFAQLPHDSRALTVAFASAPAT